MTPRTQNPLADKVHVLVVDDRPENLVALVATLSSGSCHVVTAGSGEQALRQVLKHDFAVILLDVRMPTMDGFETARLIRGREANRNVPIIFLTATGAEVDLVYQGYSAGAVDYLVKPIDPAIVRAKVDVFIELFRKTEQIKFQEALLRAAERERGEMALRESEALYEATFNDAAVGIAHSNADGLWLRVNRQLCNILGRSREELLRMRFQDVVHPDDVAAGVSALHRMLRGELAAYRADGRVLDREGHLVWVRMSVSLVRDADGKPQHFITIVEDVSDTEEGQALLANASEVLLSSLDYKTTLARVAESMVPWLADACIVDIVDEGGTTAVEIAAARSDVLSGEMLDAVRRRLASMPDLDIAAIIRGNKPVLIGPMPDDPNGEPKRRSEPPQMIQGLGVRSVFVIPLYARGRALGALTFVASDSHASWRTGDLMMVEDVAHRVALAVENARLYQTAQEAIGARDEFISIASHELRTPLTPLQIQLQRLISERQKEPLEKLSAERVRGMLLRSERQVQRITTLIDNLLDVSRIGAGRLKLQCELVDLAEIVKDVSGRFTDELRRSEIALTLNADTSVAGWWDPLRIEQVVTNLIGNAIKYGGNGPIEIAVDSCGTNARIAVTDHGIGISLSEQGRIFGRFERAASPRSYGGLGLGLYIARQILDAHGGSITVESVPGEGSTFVVTLPLDSRGSNSDRWDEMQTEAADGVGQHVVNG